MQSRARRAEAYLVENVLLLLNSRKTTGRKRIKEEEGKSEGGVGRRREGVSCFVRGCIVSEDVSGC